MDEVNSTGQGILIALGGWVVAIIIALFTFVAQMRKGGSEETAIVLTKWKELVEAHENQISGMKAELLSMRERIHELEEVVERQNKEIANLNRQLEGERRQSAQQSRSFRNQLRALGKNDVPEERDGPDGK